MNDVGHKPVRPGKRCTNITLASEVEATHSLVIAIRASCGNTQRQVFESQRGFREGAS
jgi:hypothetical protein